MTNVVSWQPPGHWKTQSLTGNQFIFGSSRTPSSPAQGPEHANSSGESLQSPQADNISGSSSRSTTSQSRQGTPSSTASWTPRHPPPPVRPVPQIFSSGSGSTGESSRQSEPAEGAAQSRSLASATTPLFTPRTSESSSFRWSFDSRSPTPNPFILDVSDSSSAASPPPTPAVAQRARSAGLSGAAADIPIPSTERELSPAHSIASAATPRPLSPFPVNEMQNLRIRSSSTPFRSRQQGSLTRGMNALALSQSVGPSRHASPIIQPEQSNRAQSSSSRLGTGGVRHDVRTERPPEGKFNTPAVQNALRASTDSMRRLTEVLGSNQLHYDPSSHLADLYQQAEKLAAFKIQDTRTVGFIGQSGVGACLFRQPVRLSAA